MPSGEGSGDSWLLACGDGVEGYDGGGAARGGGGDVRAGAAARVVLQRVVPQRGGRREEGDGEGAVPGAQPRRAAPQDALPRLLCQGKLHYEIQKSDQLLWSDLTAVHE